MMSTEEPNESETDVESFADAADLHESTDRRRGARDSPSLMMLVLVAVIGVHALHLISVQRRQPWELDSRI